MTRAWDELVAALFDVVPAPVVLLVLLGGSVAAGALWHWYPAWVPRRLPRFRRRPDDRPAAAGVPQATTPTDRTFGLPQEPADRLAAEGRYAEAIRRRLRDTVRDLTAQGLVTPLPGSTPAELADTAAAARPQVDRPLHGATDLFSDVWYGERPAGREQDDRMRALTDEVRGR